MQTQASFDSEQLGPLSQLIGSWEGEKGHDMDHSASQPSDTRYRESITFEPVGPIRNGSEELYGLRYTTCAWSCGEEKPFHQELGYWFWSPQDQQVVRCFTNQNGVSIHAGGHYDNSDHHFEMSASASSDEHGISCSPIINEGMKTLSYKLKLDILSDKQFKYFEETHLKGTQDEDVLIHTDENALTRLF